MYHLQITQYGDVLEYVIVLLALGTYHSSIGYTTCVIARKESAKLLYVSRRFNSH